MIEIRPCRLGECSAVLTLWARAGAIPSPTDSLDEVTRLVREHPDHRLVGADQGSIVGSVIGGWDGWHGNIYRLTVARGHGLARRLVQEAERALHAKGARRFSALVERHEPTPSPSGTPSPTSAGAETPACSATSKTPTSTTAA